MFSSPRSTHPGVRAARNSRLSLIIPRRPWAALAMIVLWTAAPAFAAACGVHCHAVNLHACCQQRSMPMPNMPMSRIPLSHRDMTNTPMPASCNALVLEVASFSVTADSEELSASACARAAVTSSSAALSGSHAGRGSSSPPEVGGVSRSANRVALAPAVSAVPLRI
jgi:hypothetical protein